MSRTTNEIDRASMTARRAVQARDWATVETCAREILRRDGNSAEGHFLSGLVHKNARKTADAAEAFQKALTLDPGRYDAAVELASQYSIMRRNRDVAEVLGRYESRLENSPLYLDLAGTVYTEVGLPEKAWPLFRKATSLQPGVDLFQANMAACAVYLGKVEEAKGTYKALLERFPGHRYNHYQLSRLSRATDTAHLEQMQEILRRSNDPPARNVFLYYAIAKELEDLGQWEESFEYYRRGGDAVTSVAVYDVNSDIELIDSVIMTCDAEWLKQDSRASAGSGQSSSPIFVVGLPRTGTTLTERIISSHSSVQTLGETQFLQMVLRRESGVATVEAMNPEIIRAVADKDMRTIADGYLDAVGYRLGDEPLFVDKLPLNFLFLGFIAKAWPEARIVHLHRHPMDACFSMYKQVFTWAYKFSYSLDMLGRYYVAHERLLNHWRTVLGDRLIEVEYESLVADQERQTRRLLDRLGLPFEAACLDFDKNVAPSATASSVQVRRKVYTDSVNKWLRFADQLKPLKEHLERAGVPIP